MSNQKNTRLVKANGVPTSEATTEAINTVSALNVELGAQLKLSVLGAITSPETLDTKGDDNRKASYTEALIARIRTAFKSDDYDSIIPALEDKQKEWGNRGGQIIAAQIEEFTAWALGLGSLYDEKGKERIGHGINPDGISVSMPIISAIKASVSFCLYALTSLSNVAFKGTPEKVSPKGKVKQPKPGLFDGRKGVQSKTVEGMAGEDWKFRATVEYLVLDTGGTHGSRIRKSLELINDAANKLNNDKVAECGAILRTLTGQNPEDKRFEFDPSLIVQLVLARFCGLMYSGIGQWLKELKDAKKNSKTIAAFAADEARRLELMMADIARGEVYGEHHPEPKAETIPGSKVESTDTSAALPEATQKPITWRDRAVRRASKQVYARYPTMEFEQRDAIVERLIEQNIANSDEGTDFNDEAQFEEYFSAQAINEYLDAEEADAIDAVEKAEAATVSA